MSKLVLRQEAGMTRQGNNGEGGSRNCPLCLFFYLADGG